MAKSLKIGLKVILTLLCLGACVVLFLFWRADPYNFRAPKDQTLIQLFQDHREVFERLCKMGKEDSKYGWYFSKSHLNNVSELHQREYIKMFSEIDHVSAETVVENGNTTFIYATGGILIIGPEWHKGIQYVPGDGKKQYIGNIMPNLDKAWKLQPGYYIRPIEPHWYIFYNRTDN